MSKLKTAYQFIKIHPDIKPFMFIKAFRYLFIILFNIQNGTNKLKRVYLIGSRKAGKTKSVAIMFVIASFVLKDCTLELYRRFKDDLKDGWHSEVQEAISILGVEAHFKKSGNTYLNTINGNVIRLAGIKGASGKVQMSGRNFKAGHKILIAIDEAYELTQDEWEFVQESVRGGDRVFFLLTNPWTLYHWFIHLCNSMLPFNLVKLKEHGQQVKVTPDGSQMVHISNYKVNELLAEDDKWEFVQLEKRNPRRYMVAGLGMAGIESGSIYDNYLDAIFRPDMSNEVTTDYVFAIDYGETRDTMVAQLLRKQGTDPKKTNVRVLREFHWRPRDDYYYIDGKKHMKSKTDQTASTTYIGRKIIKWMQDLTYSVPDLMRVRNDFIECVVDNSAGAFIDGLNDECVRQDIHHTLEFRKGTKKEIMKRIDKILALSGADRFTIDEEYCPNTHKEYHQAVWKYQTNDENKLNKTLVRAGDDHCQDTTEYGVSYWWGDLKT